MPCFNAAVGAEGRVEVMLEQPAHPTAPTASEEEDQPSRLAANATATVGDLASMLALAQLSPGGEAAEEVEVAAAAQVDRSADAGYFGVGVYNSKSAENVGTLWRSAYMLGAS